jgi:hypothetical protein
MPQTYKILGQVRPTANTLTNIYVTGASTSAVVGTLHIVNPTTSNRFYQLKVRPINEASNAKHTLVYAGAVAARDAISITGGIVLAPDTILAANVTATALTFSAYGVEIT